MRGLGLFALWLMAAGAVDAEPLVTGYERFHAGASSPEEGALLYSELGCANCHQHGPALPDRRGPVLGGIKDRAKGEWIAAFLDAPQQFKAGTMMPALFEGLPKAEKAAQIESVVHYLMSLQPVGKAAKPKVGKHANAERGSARYHQVGCVACHAPTPDFHPAAGAPKPEDFSSRPVPFPDLKAKYSLLSLAAFLGNPGHARPDGRMPDLGLSEEDTLDIASHLLDFRESDPREAAALAPFKVNGELAKKGAEVAARLNCVACHRLTAEDRSVAVEINNREQPSGCLSGMPAANRPQYELSEGQRAALLAYVKLPEPPAFTAAQRTDMTLKAMNCLACHDRDGVGGPDAARNRFFAGDEGIADAGRLAPPLKGIGRKLRPEWMTGVFKGSHRARPYVLTRMPKYPAQAEWLTKLLTETDRKPLPAMVTGDPEAGRQLAGVLGGMNCITCHRWGDKPSLGIQALDISDLNQRLNPEWFRDYLLNPVGYRPGTLMPPLWPGGQSLNKDVLGGDTEKQIASLWAFIESGEGLPRGYPDHVSGAFELIPKDRPIIQRTFLNEVGTHAILAGFPGGLNVAYDGENGRPALAWKGRFFDAYSTWFVRAAPFEDPLEKEVHAWPKLSGSESGGFRGYRVDREGNPTFLITVDGVAVEDHYAVHEGTLVRTVTWPAGTAEPAWQHPGGLTLASGKPAGPHQRAFIYSWK